MRLLVATIPVLLMACGGGSNEPAAVEPTSSVETPSSDAGRSVPPEVSTDAGPVGLEGRYQLRAVHSKKCLAIVRDSRDDGARVVQRACSKASGQAFDVVRVEGDFHKLIDVFSGRALDVVDKATVDGARIQQWSWAGGENQQFTLKKQDDGTYAIVARHSGRALDVIDASTADEAPVQQWSFHGADNQRFELVPYVAPPEGFVHADGAHLRDGTGNLLIPRGVALGNWLVPEGYMWKFDGARGDRGRRIEARIEELIGKEQARTFWKTYRARFVTEADFARIAELGFDSVRLAMNARLLMPEGSDALDEEQWKHVDDVVAWCKAHHLRVILDMHAAPGGETGKNIDDSANDYPELFTVAANQDRLVKIWTELAKRYASEPAVFGYDLLNEPLPAEFSSLNPQLWKVYRKVSAAVRAVDPNHLLIVEGANWANDWSALDAPFDDNMAYSFHKYWNGNDVGAIQTYLDRRAAWNRPVWVGESGENSDEWYRASFALLEQHEIGWSFWTWKKLESGNGPYSIRVPSGWSAIQAYVGDASKKPSAATAQAALDGFLDALPLAKNDYHASAVCSILPCAR